MTRLLRPLVLLGLIPAASCTSSSSVQIRGVAPSDEATYLSAEFSCVVNGKVTNLPISRVNDEFCDCDDGRDEPGTAACSHLISAQFHCENDGFFPGKIHTSRIHDGICDCCDGSDEEIKGKSSCPNTCAVAANKHRKEAEQRLVVVKAGFDKRQATITREIAEYFNGAQEAETATQKELAGLKLLKDRVTVHKDREELKEKKYRMEAARQKQAEGHENGETSKQQFSDAKEKEAVEALEFEGLDSVRVADDDVPVNSEEDERASEVLNSRRETVKSLIELPDGTRVPLADYLRMNHNKQAPTKKRAPRTAEEMRREDFLGPLFNGDAEGRKRIGLYALRTIGIVISPVRVLIELILFSPRTLWSVLSTPEIAGSVIDKLPDFAYPSRSIWFRQLGGGSVYDGYSSVMWGARVVWDAPVYAYHYLFPKLDDELKLPVAESLRKVLREIDAGIAKLEKEQNDKREAAKMDYGPDRAYFALKDKCIEKRIEKYLYKFCAFQEIKQDHTKLGKWDGWALDNDKVDHTKMRYSKGQRCYKGPERSVLAHLECGEEDELLSVDEPSTCVYEMAVRSPLACTTEILTKAEEDVAFWTRAH
ncbi:hypothetical protein F441_16889 [Phytophthora nicotianae CJ01A1]|uniref:Glucosidase 2 subunit beta n=2 Tax=Phytophthora nicotianae TaxID=4792 RepID=W2IAT2_PHYNI|nr:hypothetical protein L915_16559 [Phytophthora nicotianae]ETL30577.1 hypothetical protein L916_16461 [Phytophthora nicotianae]ETP06751.1 hypothetical protein F441_16889 [Phytophthora nicotianae CJ01A1]